MIILNLGLSARSEIGLRSGAPDLRGPDGQFPQT